LRIAAFGCAIPGMVRISRDEIPRFARIDYAAMPNCVATSQARHFVR
jgi:hypothetical protein